MCRREIRPWIAKLLICKFHDESFCNWKISVQLQNHSSWNLCICILRFMGVFLFHTPLLSHNRSWLKTNEIWLIEPSKLQAISLRERCQCRYRVAGSQMAAPGQPSSLRAGCDVTTITSFEGTESFHSGGRGKTTRDNLEGVWMPIAVV